jgi:hypothetical protein
MFKTHRTYNLTTGVKNNSIAVVSKPHTIDVLYHKTIVVHAELIKGRWLVVLNNGGWDTISTRAVINRALEQIPGHEESRIERKKLKDTYVSVHKGEKIEREKIKGVTVTIYKSGKIELPFSSNTLEII